MLGNDIKSRIYDDIDYLGPTYFVILKLGTELYKASVQTPESRISNQKTAEKLRAFVTRNSCKFL